MFSTSPGAPCQEIWQPYNAHYRVNVDARYRESAPPIDGSMKVAIYEDYADWQKDDEIDEKHQQ
jgi:hypothetical protein